MKKISYFEEESDSSTLGFLTRVAATAGLNILVGDEPSTKKGVEIVDDKGGVTRVETSSKEEAIELMAKIAK